MSVQEEGVNGRYGSAKQKGVSTESMRSCGLKVVRRCPAPELTWLNSAPRHWQMGVGRPRNCLKSPTASGETQAKADL